MAKYIYKNTHFFATMDPKRIIKMSLKVLYAGWGPAVCYSMTFAGLYISRSPRAVATILGDQGAVSRVERRVQVREKETLGIDSHRNICKNSSGCRLLIGHKKCCVLLCPIGEHISWVLFAFSYTTAIVSITACLAHAPKKCTQSGNFQFAIKSPSDFKILSARKLKTLFQKYKLQLTTGIQACIGHVLRKYICREFLKIDRKIDSLLQ